MERFLPTAIVRLVVSHVVLVAWFTAGAVAQDIVGTGRFTVEPAGGGFIRFDTRTGQTSHCTPVDGVWSCTPIPEVSERIERTVDGLAASIRSVETRIGELEATVAAQRGDDPTPAVLDALTKRVEDIATALADVRAELAARLPPPPGSDEVAAKAEPAGFAATVIRRFVTMVRRIRDGENDHS